MGTIQELFRSFGRMFQWWVIIAPWERGLRVRRGKTAKLLEPGIHLRIPAFDRIYRQSVRLRIGNVNIQTLTTADGETLTARAMVAYAIEDLEKLYDSVHSGEDVVLDMVAGAVADYVASHTRAECSPEAVRRASEEDIDFGRFGLSLKWIRLTDFAFVRTYRLLTESGRDWTYGESLDTNRHEHQAEM